MVAAAGGDEQGAFGLVLTDDVGVIRIAARRADGRWWWRRPVLATVQDGSDFSEAFRAVDVIGGDERGFVMVVRRGDDAAVRIRGGERAREDAADGA